MKRKNFISLVISPTCFIEKPGECDEVHPVNYIEKGGYSLI